MTNLDDIYEALVEAETVGDFTIAHTYAKAFLGPSPNELNPKTMQDVSILAATYGMAIKRIADDPHASEKISVLTAGIQEHISSNPAFGAAVTRAFTDVSVEVSKKNKDLGKTLHDHAQQYLAATIVARNPSDSAPDLGL